MVTLAEPESVATLSRLNGTEGKIRLVWLHLSSPNTSNEQLSTKICRWMVLPTLCRIGVFVVLPKADENL